ncbi:MAG: hypothetical protein JNL74_23855, partial [Fibrobacteres bacterium]|nr:hypothetical protein [Fibrobacterota bacterium]
MRSIFILSLLLTASLTPALDSLLLAGCTRTGNSPSLSGFEDSLVSVLSPRLLNYGLIFLKNTANEPTDNISTMKCDIISAENVKIRFT